MEYVQLYEHYDYAWDCPNCGTHHPTVIIPEHHETINCDDCGMVFKSEIGEE